MTPPKDFSQMPFVDNANLLESLTNGLLNANIGKYIISRDYIVLYQISISSINSVI